MANRQELAPTTADATVVINCTEADKVYLVAIGGYLDNFESIPICIVASDNSPMQLCDAAGNPLALTSTCTAVLLEGGMTYVLYKPATKAPIGIDSNFKPRTGF